MKLFDTDEVDYIQESDEVDYTQELFELASTTKSTLTWPRSGRILASEPATSNIPKQDLKS